MNFLKTVFRIAAQNFRKWQTDYRIWTIAVFLTVMTLMYVDDMKKIADVVNEAVPIWIFPFLYMQFYTKLLFMLPVVLMFCDAPFTDNNQMFVITRTTSTRWLCGQIVYIILASGIYFLFLFVISLLTTIIYGNFSLDWGRTLSAAAYAHSVVYEADVRYTTVSSRVLEYFTPPLACFYTFLISWLAGIFLGLISFACNLLTGARFWGTAVCGFFVIFSIAAGRIPYAEWFSPIAWTTLNMIDIGGLTDHPGIGYCLGVYLGAIALLTLAILIFGRRKSLDVKGN